MELFRAISSFLFKDSGEALPIDLRCQRYAHDNPSLRVNRSGEPRTQAWREARLPLLHSKDFCFPCGFGVLEFLALKCIDKVG